MWNLSLTNTGLKANPQRDTGYFLNVLNNGSNICCLRTWAFDSCAIWELHGLWTVVNNCKSWQDFVDFCKGVEKAYEKMPYRPDTWYPKEILISLSTSQNIDWAEANHPQVKKIDEFLNRAHGPHTIKMFRISLE